MPAPEPSTRPIPNSYAAPDPAPNRPTECERCGAPAISRRGVAKHDLHHRAQDVDARRQKTLLDRLEAFLDAAESLTDPTTGEPQKFGDWKHEVDEILAELDGLPAAVRKLGEQLAEQPPAPAAATAPEIIPWPGDPYTPDDDDDEPPAAIVTAAEPDGDELALHPVPSPPPASHGFDTDDF